MLLIPTPDSHGDSHNPQGACPPKGLSSCSIPPPISEHRFPIPDPLAQPQIFFLPLHSLLCLSNLQMSGLRLPPPGSLQDWPLGHPSVSTSMRAGLPLRLVAQSAPSQADQGRAGTRENREGRAEGTVGFSVTLQPVPRLLLGHTVSQHTQNPLMVNGLCLQWNSIRP